MKSEFFAVVGTYRAGTSWLHQVFRAHPEIFVPEGKELFYFSRYYDRGVAWYMKHFIGSEECSVYGEVCPSYLSHDRAAQRIHDFDPNSRIIAVLREPVSQIISMAQLHSNREGMQGSRVVTLEELRSGLIHNVMYYSTIRPYLELFSRERLLVMKYDQLRHDPREFLLRIYEFLGVGFCQPSLSSTVNRATIPKVRSVEKAMSKVGEYLRAHNLQCAINCLHRTGMVRAIRGMNTTNKTCDVRITEEALSFIKESTVPEIKRIAETFSVDMDDWINRL